MVRWVGEKADEDQVEEEVEEAGGFEPTGQNVTEDLV